MSESPFFLAGLQFRRRLNTTHTRAPEPFLLQTEHDLSAGRVGMGAVHSRLAGRSSFVSQRQFGFVLLWGALRWLRRVIRSAIDTAVYNGERAARNTILIKQIVCLFTQDTTIIMWHAAVRFPWAYSRHSHLMGRSGRNELCVVSMQCTIRIITN